MGALLAIICAALAGWVLRGVAQEIADRITASHGRIG